MALPLEKERYTYADLLKWNEDVRYELIDGEAVMMAGASRIHQKVSVELSRQLANFLEGKKCEVYTSPFDVRLFEKDGDAPEDVDTVVEPDILVVCDRSKLDDKGCKGAPDLVVEILSPSTQRHDRVVKMDLYQRAGVREYWMVDPEGKRVEVYLRDESGSLKSHEVYGAKDIAKVNVLEGCFVEMCKVFPKETE